MRLSRALVQRHKFDESLIVPEALDRHGAAFKQLKRLPDYFARDKRGSVAALTHFGALALYGAGLPEAEPEAGER